jgi:hypothetical protein
MKGAGVLQSRGFDGVRVEQKLGRRAEAPPHESGSREL